MTEETISIKMDLSKEVLFKFSVNDLLYLYDFLGNYQSNDILYKFRNQIKLAITDVIFEKLTNPDRETPKTIEEIAMFKEHPLYNKTKQDEVFGLCQYFENEKCKCGNNAVMKCIKCKKGFCRNHFDLINEVCKSCRDRIIEQHEEANNIPTTNAHLHLPCMCNDCKEGGKRLDTDIVEAALASTTVVPEQAKCNHEWGFSEIQYHEQVPVPMERFCNKCRLVQSRNNPNEEWKEEEPDADE